MQWLILEHLVCENESHMIAINVYHVILLLWLTPGLELRIKLLSFCLYQSLVMEWYVVSLLVSLVTPVVYFRHYIVY